MKLVHQIHSLFFALFSQIDDHLTIEEAVEEEVWAQALGGQIECIEKNQTLEMLDTQNSFSLFSLFSEIDDLLTFEEDVKDKVWAQAMDE